MTSVVDYGTLKTAVLAELDRSDLSDKVAAWVMSAERRIFRELRVPANEAVLTVADQGTDTLTIPNDFLEVKSLTWRGVPLKRLTDLEFQERSAPAANGKPLFFGRIDAEFKIYPVPDEENELKLIYWQDQSGLTDDEDTTPVMAIAPDLYLYATLVYGGMYVEDGRMPMWDAATSNIIDSLHKLARSAELSGSVLEQENPYG